METVFFAEDEATIRKGLKFIIDWKALGFDICGEADNGEDALRRILELAPSLVLIDLSMPRLHGLDVISRAREEGFNGKFIILSGYSSFKYAQEAIKNGVNFYLTKPLDEDELYSAVCEVRDMLEKEKQQSTDLKSLRDKAKTVILYELLTDTQTSPVSTETASDLRLDADSYQVVICEDFNQHEAAAPYPFAELLRVTNRDNSTFERVTADGRDVVLLKGPYGLRKLNDFLEHFEKQPPQGGSPMDSLFLAYGRPVDSLGDIHLSYADATSLLDRRFFCAQGQHTLGFGELPEIQCGTADGGVTPLGEELLLKYATNFVGYIQSFNRRMVAQALSELEDTLSCVSDGINEIKLFLTDLYLHIREQINQNYASAEIPFSKNSAVIDFINTQNYLYEIIRFLSEQFEMIMNATGNPSRDTILDDVLFYIDHNFRHNIKLETIAPLFGYNSAYLGKIFNKAVGESFNSYIDHKRIEQSKQLLLENNLKVYEIAEQVGYKNVEYFHKKFKKYVQMSPAEFRRQAEIGA
ncbi:MAG: response regulator [Clostridiales bacterium]|nr:response regulator [Clostridiales bacterium]